MRYLYVLLFSLIFASLALADSVTMQWNPNTETDLAGYRIYQREAGHGYDYASPVWEGPETTCKIDSLVKTKSYHFVARAFDTEGYESENSNEVSYLTGTIPDGLPPGKPKVVTIEITVTVP